MDAAGSAAANPSGTEELKGARHRPKSLIGGTVGNVMEWYDFALYGYFAPVISQQFFPSDNHLTSLIATFGVFAGGFAMRPLGGVVFGWIGDRFGRLAVLRLSIVTMGAATLLLGLLPTESRVGVWAPILLVAVRLVQGLSVGGEFSGSVTYMVETSPLHRRGFAGSWANFGSLAGALAGPGLAALVTSVLADDAVQTWGWRLPFLFGGAMGIAAYLYVRRLKHMPQTAHHERQHQEDSPLHEAITQNLRETLSAIVFASGYGICFYIPLVYLPTYAHEVVGLPSDIALQINALGLALAMPFIPLAGWLSDHLLRRRTVLLIAFGAMAAAGWPLTALFAGGHLDLLWNQIALALLIALPLGAAPAMFVELFPVADRLTGYSLAYNLGLGVAGGTAPMVATWLISASGYDPAPGVYFAVGALVSVAGLLFMRDRSREPLR
ncbi:MAG: MFS transporter [Alphaproteobacteria bacterium]|nr:MFS transporter [Alphaproteobacteria bacterium]